MGIAVGQLPGQVTDSLIRGGVSGERGQNPAGSPGVDPEHMGPVGPRLPLDMHWLT